ncbi:hypothetical protein IMZ48_29855 [Candidatus Bathyarchaeota archaeon]|nr:hypothetical protein [Candidatus Bathyarchaeota archaeon]
MLGAWLTTRRLSYSLDDHVLTIYLPGTPCLRRAFTMDTLVINLKAHTAPQTSERMIAGDKIFCNSCANLNPASARSLLFERGVYVADNHTRGGAKRDTEDTVEAGEAVHDGPSLGPDEKEIDFASHQVDTYLEDIRISARRCETCRMIESVLTRLGKGAVSFSDPNQAASIIFRRGAAVWIDVVRVAGAEEDSDSDDGYFFPSSGGRRELGDVVENIDSFELYSLPGRFTSPCLSGLRR